METFRFYKSRADMAFEMAGRPENAHLRDKYLQLAEEWGAQADARYAKLKQAAVSDPPQLAAIRRAG